MWFPELFWRVFGMDARAQTCPARECAVATFTDPNLDSGPGIRGTVAPARHPHPLRSPRQRRDAAARHPPRTTPLGGARDRTVLEYPLRAGIVVRLGFGPTRCARSSADRAIDYGSIGRGFKSLRAHHRKSLVILVITRPFLFRCGEAPQMPHKYSFLTSLRCSETALRSSSKRSAQVARGMAAGARPSIRCTAFGPPGRWNIPMRSELIVEGRLGRHRSGRFPRHDVCLRRGLRRGSRSARGGAERHCGKVLAQARVVQTDGR